MYVHIKTRKTLCLVLCMLLLFVATSCNESPSQSQVSYANHVHGFVTRSGIHLMLNGRPFRFAGANIHWLALDDNANYVSQFQVNDALDSAKAMGATAVRSHTLGISTGCQHCLEPTPGNFNQVTFAHMDYVLAAARARGIRLLIPLTDNWNFAYGGKHTFTTWRGIADENQFYTNPFVIQDFQTYITTLLNHVNVYTQVAYKDDPTIMAWETGNELVPPTQWTQNIATFLKNIDPRHLVIDGRDGIDPNSSLLKNVDIVTHHYYPMDLAMLQQDSAEAKRAGKVFYVGEFGWNDAYGQGNLRANGPGVSQVSRAGAVQASGPGASQAMRGKPSSTSLVAFLGAIEADPEVAGDTYWELWPHNDEYGYNSNEPEYTLHYPGDTTAMRTQVQALRTHAYKMSNLAIPLVAVPGTPNIQVVVRGNNNLLVWRGASLAASYSVELSTSGMHGPWTLICNQCVDDTATPWLDTTKRTGDVWYKVTAYNSDRVAGAPSSPYQAQAGRVMIDALNDWSNVYEHSHNLTFDTTNAEHLHADTSSIERTTTTHEWITWKWPGLRSFQATAYFWPSEPVEHFSLSTSYDGRTWTLLHPAINELRGDWTGYIYTVQGLSHVNYIKITWNNIKGHTWNPELSQVTGTM